ncbi:hypothetical protein PoB_000522800 [Plakobranchus ocellatus]|uniref:Uncharacterized protein n=1 Tax=Plakobranchus ocellatus TaxID=259542 RepID=A0AAV3Y891_9GAST|nr:hypothetical protein PoB_000522800 [Plakobranchus ocellatus]
MFRSDGKRGAVAHLVGQLATIQEIWGSIPSPGQVMQAQWLRNPNLRSAGSFLWWVRVRSMPPTSWLDRGLKV